MLNIPEEIKNLFSCDSISKNLRINFPNGEHKDITNAQLVTESMVFTESFCSQRNLEFGLSEGSVIEFKCVGVGNIIGCTINCAIEIDISSLDEVIQSKYGSTSEDLDFVFYSVPLGVFVVDTCPRQSDMSIRRVTAYSLFVNDNNDLSEFEKAKQSLGVYEKTNYTADVASFVLSNARNGYEGNKSIFTTEELTLTEKTMVLYRTPSLIETSTLLYGDVAVLELYKDDANFEKLLQIHYEKVDNFNSVKKEIISLAKSMEPYIGVHAKLNSGWIEHSSSSFVVHSGDSSTTPIDTDFMLYPFITGLKSTDEPFLTIIIPLKLRLVLIDKTNPEEKILGEWNIANGYRVERCTISDDVFKGEFSFERVKKINTLGITLYRCQEEIAFKNIINGFLEINGMFGKISREGGISLVGINDLFALYPSETLYPSKDLFPKGTVVSAFNYKSLWYEEYSVKPFGKVHVKYQNEDNEDAIYVYEFDSESPNVYYFKDNFIFNNGKYLQSEIKEILDKYFIPKIKDITYVPVEIEMRGLPHIEAGDSLTILTKTGGFETIVFQRVLRGIHNLMDNIETTGDQYNPDAQEL